MWENELIILRRLLLCSNVKCKSIFLIIRKYNLIFKKVLTPHQNKIPQGKTSEVAEYLYLELRLTNWTKD